MAICRCDGRYQGCDHPIPCPNPGGGHISPYFCVDCDPRRISHVSRNLEQMAQDMRKSEQDYQALVAELLLLRRSRNITTAELVRRSGLAQPTVKTLESGSREGSLVTLMRYARALGARLRVHVEVPGERRWIQGDVIRIDLPCSQ